MRRTTGLEEDNLDNDRGMGIAAKLTLGVLLWSATKGLMKLGAMAGAALLGWKLVTRMLGRSPSTDAATVPA